MALMNTVISVRPVEISRAALAPIMYATKIHMLTRNPKNGIGIMKNIPGDLAKLVHRHTSCIVATPLKSLVPMK